MLAALDRLSHGILRALGGRSVQVPTPAGRVHAYEVRGPGDGSFVLLHGMGTTATSYTRVVQRLRKHASRIVVLDLPGHGRSEPLSSRLDTDKLANGVRTALDALIDERAAAVILGTSLGGAAALGYALDRPGRVRALVLASPAGAPLEPADVESLRARFDLKTRADARRFFAELLHDPPFYSRMLEKSLVSQLNRPLVQEFLAAIGPDDFFTIERLATLRPPTTVLWGKSDRVLPRSGLAFYRRALPRGTTFEELEGIGHSPHLERPDLVASRLRSAFETARSRQPAS